MRMSRGLFPTLRENPADAVTASHRLMLRAGLVRQTSSGIYAWLPLGLRALPPYAASCARNRTPWAARRS